LPGHSTAVGFSYPELVTAFMAEWHNYCSEPPRGALKLNPTAVYDFVSNLFNDLLPRVFPYSAYFHTGGDEIDNQDYLLDNTVNSSDTKVLTPLLQKLLITAMT
jgi:hexosaminidase